MLLISLNRTLTVMLHHVAKILTKCGKVKHVYEVLCAKQTTKIWCKILMDYNKYRNFCVGTFYSDSPCILSHTLSLQQTAG